MACLMGQAQRLAYSTTVQKTFDRSPQPRRGMTFLLGVRRKKSRDLEALLLHLSAVTVIQ